MDVRYRFMLVHRCVEPSPSPKVRKQPIFGHKIPQIDMLCLHVPAGVLVFLRLKVGWRKKVGSERKQRDVHVCLYMCARLPEFMCACFPRACSVVSLGGQSGLNW